MNEPASYPPLIAALLRPEAYPHPVASIAVAETHISWVLLTGKYAYKIKKPVQLPFLDFSTLDLRRQACEQELRLNRRFAPHLYEAVVPICGTPLQPRIGGDGPPFEFAVKMRQFPAAGQLDHRLEEGRLDGDDLEAFGQALAQLHARAAVSTTDDRFSTASHVQAPLHDTLEDLLQELTAPEQQESLHHLGRWCAARENEFASLFEARKRNGRIREGHGDLHLANLVWLDGAIVPFDCIEFSDDLRWNDVISDAAFLVMDLLHRNCGPLAYRFLNAYLEAGGDYEGLPLLPYYLVYRALVRAKVETIRARGLDQTARGEHLDTANAYVALARSLAFDRHPLLILMHGLSGSGKSWISRRLAPELPAIRIRSDVERKRLHGLAAQARTGSEPGGGIYSGPSTDQTYHHLSRLAKAALEGGENVIVDACFLKAPQRSALLAMARQAGIPCRIVDCRAPAAVLESRVSIRAQGGHDASEADARILAGQRATEDPLNDDELALTVPIDSSAPLDLQALIRRLRTPAAQTSSPVSSSQADLDQ